MTSALARSAGCSFRDRLQDSPLLHLATELFQLGIANPPNQIPDPPLAEKRSPISLLGVVLNCRSAASRDREAVLLRSGRRGEMKLGDEFGEAALVLIGAEAVEVWRQRWGSVTETLRLTRERGTGHATRRASIPAVGLAEFQWRRTSERRPDSLR